MMLAAGSQAQVTHELLVEDDEFNPPSLTINAGDHVHILWDNSVTNDHTFTQVEEATWNVNGTTPLPGGYDFGVGTANPGTEFTITPSATVWYVCVFHADMGMKGVITVAGTGIEEPVAQDLFVLAPNPANANLTVTATSSGTFIARITDAAGRTAGELILNGEGTIDTHDLGAGLYIMEFRTLQGILLSRQRLILAR